MHNDWLQPDWHAPEGVGAVMTSRHGGVSHGPFDSMNLGDHVGDQGASVQANRLAFAAALGAEPVWLQQVHGATVVALESTAVARPMNVAPPAEATRPDPPIADAAFTLQRRVACVVQVADCLPVLLAASDGRVVGAAHAGWRGLAAGVLGQTVRAMCAAAGCRPGDLQAWLGPCIGAEAFEVGDDVVEAFADHPTHFLPTPRRDGVMRWRADLHGLARAMLRADGVATVTSAAGCTVSEPLRFFSYRRDGQTGRHAAAIWIR